MGKVYRIIQNIFRIENNYAVIILIFFFSCNGTKDKTAYEMMVQYSNIDIKESDVKLIKFDVKTAGVKEEKIYNSIFSIENLGVDSLQLFQKGYKRLPAVDLELGDGFGGNISNSDSGYYKLKLLHGIMNELIIFNLSQRKIIYYKVPD